MKDSSVPYFFVPRQSQESWRAPTTRQVYKTICLHKRKITNTKYNNSLRIITEGQYFRKVTQKGQCSIEYRLQCF